MTSVWVGVWAVTEKLLFAEISISWERTKELWSCKTPSGATTSDSSILRALQHVAVIEEGRVSQLFMVGNTENIVTRPNDYNLLNAQEANPEDIPTRRFTIPIWVPEKEILFRVQCIYRMYKGATWTCVIKKLPIAGVGARPMEAQQQCERAVQSFIGGSIKDKGLKKAIRHLSSTLNIDSISAGQLNESPLLITFLA